MLTIIENVHVYEPEDLGRRYCGLPGKIVEVGPLLACLPQGQKVNAQGLMAVPGFIDQHVHVTGEEARKLKTRVPELKLTGASSCYNPCWCAWHRWHHSQC